MTHDLNSIFLPTGRLKPELNRKDPSLIKFLHDTYNETIFPGYESWIVPIRFRGLKCIGTGAYSFVCEAFDVLTEQRVAIKKMNTPFRDSLYAIRSIREVYLLHHLEHPNVINSIYCFTNTGTLSKSEATLKNFRNFYIVTPLIGRDLNQVIRTNKFTHDHIKYVAYQILNGLNYVHQRGLVHRDLKPGNICVNDEVDVKIIDFGLARLENFDMTGYVVTRYYRAPEIILRWEHYDKKIDVWSAACIIIELLTGEILFKGTSHIEQVVKIIQFCGSPPEEFINSLEDENTKHFLMNRLGKYEAVDSTEYFTDKINSFMGPQPENVMAVDFIRSMLKFQAKDRPSAVECLKHPYLKKYLYEEDLLDIQTEPLQDDYTQKTGNTIEQWREDTFDLITKVQREQIERLTLDAGQGDS